MDDLLKKFNAAGVRYLLIGSQAMRLLGMPPFSIDWDFFIPPRDDANLERLNALLSDDLDAPLEPLGSRGENFIQTYRTGWGIRQFHLGLLGVPTFDDAEAAAIVHHTEHGTPVPVLSGQHLLAAKEAANRPQDQLDVQFLQELRRAGKLR